MASWLHCAIPEPHSYHEWSSEGPIGFWLSSHACPGVKDSELLRSMIEQRDQLRGLVEAWDRQIRQVSIEHRRTPNQFYMNDDNAPPEEPDE